MDLQIKPCAQRGVLCAGGAPVLKWEIVRPCFLSRRFAPAAARLNAFYRDRALGQRRLICRELYPGAAEARRIGAGALPYTFLSQYTAALTAGTVASLYADTYQYTGGANGTTTRVSETWNLASGRRITLGALFPARPGWEGYVLRQIRAQIARDPSIYFPDADRLAVQYFDPRRFYLTPDGVTVYYALYEIAPHSTGIPAFLLPYE